MSAFREWIYRDELGPLHSDFNCPFSAISNKNSDELTWLLLCFQNVLDVQNFFFFKHICHSVTGNSDSFWLERLFKQVELFLMCQYNGYVSWINCVLHFQFCSALSTFCAFAFCDTMVETEPVWDCYCTCINSSFSSNDKVMISTDPVLASEHLERCWNLVSVASRDTAGLRHYSSVACQSKYGWAFYLGSFLAVTHLCTHGQCLA